MLKWVLNDNTKIYKVYKGMLERDNILSKVQDLRKITCYKNYI
jgi:hypothetical protein